jgi:hypothetical protein
LLLEVNLSGRPAPVVPAATGRVLWQHGTWQDGAGPWFVRWSAS